MAAISMSAFQIIFTPTAAAELTRMPKELQLEILGDFRGLPQHLIAGQIHKASYRRARLDFRRSVTGSLPAPMFAILRVSIGV